MGNQEYKKEVFRKVIGITLSVLGVLVIVYLIGFAAQPDPIPEQFAKVYKDIARESKYVSELANLVADKVEEVGNLESEGRASTALQVIEDAKDGNNRTREKSKELAKKIENLVKMVSEVESYDQQRDLLAAVQTELILVREMVDYTSNMDSFLDSLSIVVVSDEPQDEVRVEQNLKLVNDKRKTINDLNSQFLAKVSQFGIFD